MIRLTHEQIAWCDEHAEEAIDLLRVLGRIPAPSHHEEQRAAFVADWLRRQGAQGVYIDGAGNVIYPYQAEENAPVAVLMTHMDVVFPDTTPLPLREEGETMYAPGIGDDTANLVVLLMAAKYLAQHQPTLAHGLLIVANVCEEGLGNLKGSQQIMEDFAGRVKELISLDGGMEHVTNRAVGSHRMKVTIHAQGGHSYSRFGNTNAIVQMADLITRLYQKEPPTSARTTYNVGVIEGGTTVNSICAQCSMLYEFRSESRECLADMDAFFQKTIEDVRTAGVQVDVEVLGIRPCNGDVDPARLRELTARAADILHTVTGREILENAGSTDANMPLSLGVPAVTIGAVDGGLAHTREEWIHKPSLRLGQQVALMTVLQYAE